MFLLFLPSSIPCVKFFLFFLHFSVFLLFVCLSYFPLFVLPELLLLFSFFLSLTPFCLPFFPQIFPGNISSLWKGVTQDTKITLLRVIPTVTRYSDIASDIPSGSICGIYIYTQYIYIYSDILSDILSGIYSDILSGILSGIPSGIHSDILSGICAYILSGIPSGIYSDSLSGTYTGTYTGILPGISSGHSFWHSILTSYSDVLSDILSDMGSDNAIWHFMAFYLFCCSGPGAPHCVRSSHYGVRRSQCSKTTGVIAASEGKRKEGRKEGGAAHQAGGEKTVKGWCLLRFTNRKMYQEGL